MNLAVPIGSLAALLPNRKARVHAVRVTAIAVAFVALLATGFQHRRDLSDLFKVASVRTVHTAGLGQAGQSEVLRPHDPRSEFPVARVGLMLFSTQNTDFCRRALFDNRTGLLVDAGQVDCGQPPDQPSEHVGQERVLSLLKAFRR